MRIEDDTINGFMISSGNGRNERYFCFLVDDDRACWTHTKPWQAKRFETIAEAEAMVIELRRRDSLRRSWRQKEAAEIAMGAKR